MPFIVITMFFIVAAAGILVALIAYPARGRSVPNAPWADEMLAKLADRAGLSTPESAQGLPGAGDPGHRQADGRHDEHDAGDRVRGDRRAHVPVGRSAEPVQPDLRR